jgi:hypothetical protein
MKLVVLRFAAVTFACGLALVAGGSCTVSHRSSDFACEKQADCVAGRICTDGFCVSIDGGGGIDAPAACPAQCTSCNTNAKSCTIDCALNGGCRQQVTCPTGWSCNIACSADGACANGINCLNGTSCTVVCSGRQSCGQVTCGAGMCNVECTGRDSCSDIRCGQSCACDVACRQSTSCADLICRSQQCTLPAGGGCTSIVPTSCNTCP